MRRLSFVLPYYLNPGMLAVQYRTWAAYPGHLKARIEVVVVDDGSPRSPAADVPRPDGLPKLRIYRVLEDRPWHQHAARNLGAHVADGPWLFLTDMDHIMPTASLERLLELHNGSRVYTFARLDAPDLKPMLGRDGRPKAHPNSFAMSKTLFWKVGGYDEEFCGVYGTDGLFRSRLFAAARETRLEDAPIVRYSRDVVADASTTTLPRKEGRAPGAKREVRDRKAREGREGEILTLAFPWERVL
jgi:hypothetical protein